MPAPLHTPPCLPLTLLRAAQRISDYLSASAPPGLQSASVSRGTPTSGGKKLPLPLWAFIVIGVGALLLIAVAVVVVVVVVRVRGRRSGGGDEHSYALLSDGASLPLIGATRRELTPRPGDRIGEALYSHDAAANPVFHHSL